MTPLVTAKLPPNRDANLNWVAALCQAAALKVTGVPPTGDVTRTVVAVEEIPDDRPTQTSASRYVTEVRLGTVALFRVTEEVGGWSQGWATWATPDFVCTGPLRLDFDVGGITVEGAPSVVEAFAALLKPGVVGP